MSSNIGNKYLLKTSVLNKIKDNNTLALISAESGVNFNTLKRQVNDNHEYLTLHKVLVAISNQVKKPINDCLKTVKA